MTASVTPEAVRRNEQGLRYSAWLGHMPIGHVTAGGYIVGENVLWSSGRIAMMRDQAEIAVEHGWIIDAPAIPGEQFDVVVWRV